MADKDLIRFQHMLESIKAIFHYLEGKSRDDLDNDRLLLSGIVRELEIIGEAAGNISNETKHQLPDLPWKQMIGMRNRLIHAYFDIDRNVVWITINVSLRSLLPKIEKIVFNRKINNN